MPAQKPVLRSAISMEARDWERGVRMVKCGKLEISSNVVGK